MADKTKPKDGPEAPQVVPGDNPTGAIPADKLAGEMGLTAEATSQGDIDRATAIAQAQIKEATSDKPDDDFADYGEPAQPTGAVVAGSQTRPGGAFWVGHRLVDCEGRTLKVHKPLTESQRKAREKALKEGQDKEVEANREKVEGREKK